MPRDIGALGTELDKFSVATATLVMLDWHQKDDAGEWKPATLYLTNSNHNISYGGNTYQAIGSLGAIAGAEEGLDLQSYNMTLTLSGVPKEFMSQVFNDVSFANAYTNRPAKVYTAFLDSNYQIIDSPVLIFSGQMDAASVEIGESVSVQIVVQSRLINWEIPRGGRFNEGSQASRYPLDTGFRYVKRLQDAKISFPGGIFSGHRWSSWGT